MIFPSRLRVSLTLLLHVITVCLANVEKIVFLGPESTQIPKTSPSFEDLHLQTLTPANSSIRLELPRVFGNSTHPRGLSSWYLLNDLEPGRRYELRICWAGTEATIFWPEKFGISTVFNTPELITDLAAFSEARNNDDSSTEALESPSIEGEKSLLFYRIQAVADFFTLDQEYMQNPPPVLVDLSGSYKDRREAEADYLANKFAVLDPYLLNICPKSLLPTAIYIGCIAVVSYFVSGWAWRVIERTAERAKHQAVHNERAKFH
ncbi:MAG: hypothetical protein Q9162_001271 [Coniocarpon cinnabarinum]